MHDFVQSALLPGMSEGAIYGLIAVAFAVLFTTTGVINFAHGQMVMLMPMAILVAVGAGLPVWIAYVLALAVMIGVGLLQEWAAVRPFMQSGHSASWILSTLGVSVILAELLAIPYAGESKNFTHGISAERIEVLGFTTSPANVATVIALLAVSAALMYFYRRTKPGLEIRAMAEDVDGAEAIGISRARASQTAMTLSILVAAVTGILVASTQLVTPSLGLTYTFYGFVATAMGGMGSIAGALVGGLVVGVVSQSAAVYFDGLFVNLAVFGLLLAVYVIRPHGLFGRAPVREV
ncbi:branched-chain amino acid ABC transporter permease [Rhodococcus sp. NPDC003318]|uniref:branched-chain amino acid ABC transporter permease n=1 Tax=Rhodococcus sp. NPDC003318 TaxID=3364503 RepID=UPI0036A3374F